MADIIASSLISIGVGVLLALPALALGYWLQKTGRAPNRSWFSLFFCLVFAFIKQIWLPGLSYSWLALILIAGSTLGVYRMDIYWASKNANNSNSEP